MLKKVTKRQASLIKRGYAYVRYQHYENNGVEAGTVLSVHKDSFSAHRAAPTTWDVGIDEVSITPDRFGHCDVVVD
jgi:hypothetical protein